MWLVGTCSRQTHMQHIIGRLWSGVFEPVGVLGEVCLPLTLRPGPLAANVFTHFAHSHTIVNMGPNFDGLKNPATQGCRPSGSIIEH